MIIFILGSLPLMRLPQQYKLDFPNRGTAIPQWEGWHPPRPPGGAVYTYSPKAVRGRKWIKQCFKYF